MPVDGLMRSQRCGPASWLRAAMLAAESGEWGGAGALEGVVAEVGTGEAEVVEGAVGVVDEGGKEVRAEAR